MSRYVLYPDELLHYGVKGMKWGVRRYQNYDGTRIGTGGDPVIRKGKAVSNAYRNSIAGGQGGKAKGNARLAATAGGAKKSGALDRTIPNGKGKEKVSPAEKLARDSSNLASGGKELTRAIRDADPKVKQKKEAAQSKQLKKAKKMSDQELRDSINRIKMEREYASLTTKETKSGYDKAMDVLEISGKVLFVVATALSIASTVKKMKSVAHADTSAEEEALYAFLKNSGAPEDVIIHAMELDTEYLEDWLEHHGVKGMKWGVRRYQNYDGTRIGVGSGAGGGGGGSSKKASLSSRFKKSIAGGQGGKAEGTARLAAGAKPSLFKKKEPKWGDSKYQNKDGSLTEAGKKEYYDHKTVTDKDGKVVVEWDSLNDKGKQVQADYWKKTVRDRADIISNNAKKANDQKYLDAKKQYQDNMYLAQLSYNMKPNDTRTKQQMQEDWVHTEDSKTYNKLRDNYIREAERVVKESYGGLYDKPYKTIDPWQRERNETIGKKIVDQLVSTTEMEYYFARDKQKTIRPKL